jgi:hypothetical protein
MAAENRIYTQNPFQEVTSAKLNDIQDNWCFSWELDQSGLAPTTPLEGATLYYGQFPNLAPGAPGLHVLDNSRDWRNRILLMHLEHVTNANDLPKGGSYDPNDVASVPDWTLWYTQIGATATDPPSAPPAGFNWLTNDGTDNRRIFAANTAHGGAGVAIGDLAIWVDPGGGGGSISHFMIHIIQLSDAS